MYGKFSNPARTELFFHPNEEVDQRFRVPYAYHPRLRTCFGFTPTNLYPLDYVKPGYNTWRTYFTPFLPIFFAFFHLDSPRPVWHTYRTSSSTMSHSEYTVPNAVGFSRENYDTNCDLEILKNEDPFVNKVWSFEYFKTPWSTSRTRISQGEITRRQRIFHTIIRKGRNSSGFF